MKADIAIIGGGIIGSAAAYFLAADGRAGEVVVLEPDPSYTRATTPQAAGGVRRLFSLPENIRMSVFSLDFYARCSELLATTGENVDIAFRRQGYLFTVTSEGARTLEANARLQESEGVDVVLLDVDALRSRFPSVGTDDVALACHSPNDGWINPHAALQAFRARAQSLGVTYVNERVVGFELGRNAVLSAMLGSGDALSAGCFINTAGAWAGEVAAMAGETLPVVPMCRVQHFWLCDQEIEPLPLIKDETGMFFRPEGEGFAGGRPSHDIKPGFVWDIDRGYFADYFEETVWPLIAARVPKFERIRLQSTWGGHYAQNLLDGNMIIGRFSQRLENIYTACGFSGHGIMHAPAVGRALGELLLDGDFQSIDLSRMGYQRILEEAPYREIGIT